MFIYTGLECHRNGCHTAIILSKNATMVLECKGDELRIRINDDGQGFDVAKVTDIEESGRGRGVFSMKERVRFLGG